jgi:sugar diacid utilization regulator
MSVNRTEKRDFPQNPPRQTTDLPQLIFSDAAFKQLRRDLIHTLGMEMAADFLFRFGWNCGKNESAKHSAIPFREGISAVAPTVCEVDLEHRTVHLEGIWKYSEEALDYSEHFGPSRRPVCATLTGYLSAYLTRLLGLPIYVKETSCAAMGNDCCQWTAKTAEEWKRKEGADISKADLSVYKETWEHTYSRLKKERDNFYKSIRVHQKLTKELINHCSLQSIADIVHEITGIPVLIENEHFDLLKFSGILPEQAESLSSGLKQWFANWRTVHINAMEIKETIHELQNQKSTVHFRVNHQHSRLITPILLNNRIKGYVSFVDQEQAFTDIDYMILEQAASACTLYLLNEQSAAEAEKRIHGLFFEELLSNRLSKEEAVKRGHYFGINLEKRYYIIVMSHSAANHRNEEVNDNLINIISQHFKKEGRHFLICQKEGNIVILYSCCHDRKDEKQIKKLCAHLQNLVRAAYPHVQFRFGISAGSEKIENVTNHYDEAVTALKITSSNNEIFSYQSLGIAGVLFKLGKKSAIEQYISSVLGKLLDYDLKKNGEFTKTLYYFLNNGGNLYQTTTDLSISLSGLRYRLEKIEQILGMDLRAPHTSHQLFLALQALLVLGKLNLD